MDAYYKTAKDARVKVLDLIYSAQSSHIGSNFSCIDILTVLFDKVDLDKDRIILSAGWKAASLYYFLWKKGRITEEELNSYCQEGSPFIGLAEPIHKDIPVAGGSMGLGLPMAVGLAMAKKMQGKDGTVYVLMSDGEMNCGTTWESAAIAAHNKLDNLVVIVDKNDFQAMGETANILQMEHLGFRFKSFDWSQITVDGHDYRRIAHGLNTRMFAGAPHVVIAQTVKGKGVSFMENENLWHYKAPNEDEYLKAKAELCQTS